MDALTRTMPFRFWLWLIRVVGVIMSRRLSDILEGTPPP
jgi:hypothetical protein